VEFLEQIRPERKFDSVEELRRAILSDIAQAKRFFNIAE
jgi:FAD synthase